MNVASLKKKPLGLHNFWQGKGPAGGQFFWRMVVAKKTTPYPVFCQGYTQIQVLSLQHNWQLSKLNCRGNATSTSHFCLCGTVNLIRKIRSEEILHKVESEPCHTTGSQASLTAGAVQQSSLTLVCIERKGKERQDRVSRSTQSQVI